MAATVADNFPDPVTIIVAARHTVVDKVVDKIANTVDDSGRSCGCGAGTATVMVVDKAADKIANTVADTLEVTVVAGPRSRQQLRSTSWKRSRTRPVA